MKTLDDDIRDAFAALDGTTPEGYFDGLSARVDERLEVEAMGPEMIAGMSSNGNEIPMAARVKPAAPAKKAEPQAREENTGLHDIKEMAKVRQAKISRRHTTQSDAEESLLNSASSSSLSAIVLPTPGKGDDNYLTDAAATSAAATSVGGAASSISVAAAANADQGTRTGMPVWVYGAVVVAAAAAGVIFYLTRAGGDAGNEIAAADLPAAAAGAERESGGEPPSPPPAAPTALAIPDDSAPTVAAIVESDDDGLALGAAASDTDGASQNAAAADPAAVPVSDTKADKPVKLAAVSSKTSSKKPRKTSKSDRGKSSARGSSTGRSSSKSKKPARVKKVSKPKDGAKRSLDDLLDEAAGGAKSNRDMAASDKKKPAKPSKTELTRADIKTGMRKVLGRVGRCHDKFKVSGNVMIKVVILPSGKVSSAKATGKFKNTDTGLCVANAVGKTKFPAWSGSRQSFSYPFLLSQ